MRMVEDVILFGVVVFLGFSSLWLAISGRAKFKERARNATTKAKDLKNIAQDFANTPVSPAEFKSRMLKRIKRKR